MAPRSIEAYRISLESYLRYLVTEKQVRRQNIGFDHFGRQFLKDWLVWMRQTKKYEPATIGLRLSAVKAFLNFASAEDLTLVAVYQAAKNIKAPATPRKPIEYLQENETAAILAAYDGKDVKARRNRMLLILLYDSGARVGEITALTIDDLALAKPAHLTLTGKRDKSRVVPLGEKTVEHLKVYLDEFHPQRANRPATRPLFYSFHRGQPPFPATPSPRCSRKPGTSPANGALRSRAISTATCCGRPRPWTSTSKAYRCRSSCNCSDTKA